MTHNEIMWIECQMCGERLYEMTPAEAQEAAFHPEKFIVQCLDCFNYEMNSPNE